MIRLERHSAVGPFFTLAFATLVVFCLWAARDFAVPVALAFLAWFLITALKEALLTLPLIGPHLPRWLARGIAATLLFATWLLAVQLATASLVNLTSDLEVSDNPMMLRLWAWAAGQGLTEHLTQDALVDRITGEGLLGSVLETAQTFVSDVSLVLIYTLFLLVDEKFYDAKLHALWPDDDRRATIRAVLAEIGGEIRAYLWLTTVISAGVGVFTYAICLWMGVEGAIFWGLLAFGLNYIPTIGTLLGVMAPALFATVTLSQPGQVLLIVGLLGLVQFIAGNVVMPRMMGERLNLSTLVIMLSLVVWGALWGAAGMFLAVPLMVILVMVFAKFRVTRPIAIVLSQTGRVPQGARLEDENAPVVMAGHEAGEPSAASSPQEEQRALDPIDRAGAASQAASAARDDERGEAEDDEESGSDARRRAV